ncbi:TonB-dependent receptor [Bowmanella denitrificans]|uniref:TonB-dependent receptor n=1 Tax=Bowmanella denitrificans TaxID=366582 RepID=UPI000C999273|nr:TonB-dependent receptor [Bowmanella denitrificans]
MPNRQFSAPKLLLLSTFSVSSITGAQEPSVTDGAQTAFGEKQGIESIGLYNEVMVRGFDLTQSGAYRINEHYFARASGLSESLLAGLTVSVGITAAQLDLPSPSGVVLYRLREPQEQNSLSLSLGVRDIDTLHADAQGTLITADNSLALSGHILAQPEYHGGTAQSGQKYSGGSTLRWQPDDNSTVYLFAGMQTLEHDGNVQVYPAQDNAPPSIPLKENLAPDWARYKSTDGAAGLLYQYHRNDWTLDASVTHSFVRTTRNDTTLLSIDKAGQVNSTIYHLPATRSSASAVETKLVRQLHNGKWQHSLGIGLRGRRSNTDLVDAYAIDGGQYRLTDSPFNVAVPMLPVQWPMGRDKVDQQMASLNYAGDYANLLSIRLGAHRSRYEKDVQQPSGLSSFLSQDDWFFNASLTTRLDAHWQLFGSFVNGLEENGVAPASASNYGEVMAPVKAQQWELGFNLDVSPQITLQGSLFDIDKPVTGIAANGRYQLVGDVSHKGLELSLAGDIFSATRVVLGGVWLDASLQGQNGNRAEPAGVSSFNATFNVEHRLSNNWAIDAQLVHEGARRMWLKGDTEIPGVSFLTLGFQHNFKLNDIAFSLRGQWINALDKEGYYATSSGALVPIWPQSYRLMLNSRF